MMDEREEKREESRPERHLRLVPPPEPPPEPRRQPLRLWLFAVLLAGGLGAAVWLTSFPPAGQTVDDSIGLPGEEMQADVSLGHPEIEKEEWVEGMSLSENAQ